MDKVFDPLYKRNSNGKVQSWTIRVEDNKIYTKWGCIGGTIQESAPELVYGKNVGKSNATTDNQQALLQAQAEYDKKLKKGYVTTSEQAVSGVVDSVIEGGIWPMLAEKYLECSDKIQWPAFVQPKLDGHRCVAMFDSDGNVTLWSRSRKQIHSMPHVVAALYELKLKDISLDGELYSDAFKTNFEELTHFIRQSAPVDGHECMHYHIYDIADASKTFTERTAQLSKILAGAKHPLVKVATEIVKSDAELDAAFHRFRALRYEGAMVRNADSVYQFKRTADLQKLKQFYDAEFEVVGVKSGTGKMDGLAVFTCKTDAGVEFDVKMRGKLESLRQYCQNPEKAIGRLLTVRYQDMTAKGKPRIPVALRFYEAI